MEHFTKCFYNNTKLSEDFYQNILTLKKDVLY